MDTSTPATDAPMPQTRRRQPRHQPVMSPATAGQLCNAPGCDSAGVYHCCFCGRRFCGAHGHSYTMYQLAQLVTQWPEDLDDLIYPLYETHKRLWLCAGCQHGRYRA